MPPPSWLEGRHRDLPAVFRDTFSNTEAQQTAIKDFFTGWDTEEKHHLHPLVGNLITSSVRSVPVVQPDIMNHTVAYYLGQLRSREEKSSGLIIYNVDIRKARRAQAFSYGPEGLNFYKFDAYKSTADFSVECLVLMGMKATWTTPHIDPGGDSTWSMLLEGRKVWVFARPEHTEAFIAYFTKPVKWKQWSKEDRRFLVDHRCLMIIQRPGDIVYVPHGWPHMVKHLTDTLAFNSSVLHGWLVADAIGQMDLDRCTQDEMDMFMAVRTFVEGGHERILSYHSLTVTGCDSFLRLHPLLQHFASESYTLRVPLPDLRQDGLLVLATKGVSGHRDWAARPMHSGGKNSGAQVSSGQLHYSGVGVPHDAADEAARRGLLDPEKQHQTNDHLQKRHTHLLGPSYPLVVS